MYMYPLLIYTLWYLHCSFVWLQYRYYSWSVAAPMIMAALLYQQPLPDKCQSSLEKRYALKNKDKVQL